MVNDYIVAPGAPYGSTLKFDFYYDATAYTTGNPNAGTVDDKPMGENSYSLSFGAANAQLSCPSGAPSASQVIGEVFAYCEIKVPYYGSLCHSLTRWW